MTKGKMSRANSASHLEEAWRVRRRNLQELPMLSGLHRCVSKEGRIACRFGHIQSYNGVQQPNEQMQLQHVRQRYLPARVPVK